MKKAAKPAWNDDYRYPNDGDSWPGPATVAVMAPSFEGLEIAFPDKTIINLHETYYDETGDDDPEFWEAGAKAHTWMNAYLTNLFSEKGILWIAETEEGEIVSALEIISAVS
jgi:hypothetical protein